MDEDTEKEYILQWSGHAARITERFSGLLARQALVDVTLICQQQKLRVHKLVLASCSLYFEEMLEQDLGQEPIILLKDLDFDILKAMVEFMYCGETTIAHCHLQTLLDAAKIFKVKDLESMVQSMMKSESFINTDKSLLKTEESTNNCIQVKLRGKEIPEKLPITTLLSPTEFTYEDANSKDEDQLAEQSSPPSPSSSLSLSPSSSQDSFDQEMIENNLLADAINETSTNTFINEITSPSIDEATSPNFHLETLNFTSNAESPESATNVSKSCDNLVDLDKIPPSVIKDSSPSPTSSSNLQSFVHSNQQNSDLDYLESSSSVGECSKVYTHKKRTAKKSQINLETSSLNVCDIQLPESIATDDIDLSDELYCDNTNIPVTLPPIIETEMTDYLWRLSTENINHNFSNNSQSNSLSADKQANLAPRELKNDTADEVNAEKMVVTNYKSIRHIKEIFSIDSDNIAKETTPILRRSVRLNQAEDDSVNNNDKIFSKAKNKFEAIKSLSKAKRKIKDSGLIKYNNNVADENIVNTHHQQQQQCSSEKMKKVNGNKLRPLIKRNAGKIASKSGNNSTKIGKVTRTSKLKSNKLDKVVSSDNEILVPTKLNTTASVDRALWGDMSDILENDEDIAEIPQHSLSKQIPFAVGLLPLHAALERMQAMPDYQPRKTRSSVAPSKVDGNGYLKRKATILDSELFYVKRQNNFDRIVGNGCQLFKKIMKTSSSEEAQNDGNCATNLTDDDNFSNKKLSDADKL